VQPEQIAVFTQNDRYGDSGFKGVMRILRKHGRSEDQILRVGYERNSLDVSAAVQTILKQPDLKAVVMVPTYRPAARFIHQVKQARPDMIFTNVSFVGSIALAEELRQYGPDIAKGVIVTQVVPPIDSQSNTVRNFRNHLKAYHPEEPANFVSLEGYLAAMLFVEGLKRAGDSLNTETMIAALESIKDYDMGLGVKIGFGPSDHQASDKVWGTVLDEQFRFQPLALD
jgi:ABC-type branched-subunit amino acid transport system substrate-binding protein